MDKIVACWHHGSRDRLKYCLDNGYCDLHPLAEDCPPRRMSAETFYAQKLGLTDPGKYVRFSVRRVIVATGRIKSRPYNLKRHKGIEPIDPNWPGAVDVDDIKWLDTNQRCVDPAGAFGSHRMKDC